MRLIEYGRLSLEDRRKGALKTPRLSKTAQFRATARDLADRGWESAAQLFDDGVSARKVPMDKRPMLVQAFAMIAAGEADGIIVALLDRLARNAREFATILELANHPRQGFTLVILDLGVDTSTTDGKFMAQVRASMAEWEGNKISDRTIAALAEKREQGVVLGRPRIYPDSTAARCKELYAGGKMSYRAVARRLNQEGVPTATGGTWSHQSVALLVQR